MEVQHLIDKSTWGDGPWQNEPDWVEWTEAETGTDTKPGYLCRAVRQAEMGFWCGYVGVHGSHPCYMVPERYIDRFQLKVHGGIDFCGWREDSGDSGLWWLGFSCNHGGDICPGRDAMLRLVGAPRFMKNAYKDWHYRSLSFVRHNCLVLGIQLREIAGRSA